METLHSVEEAAELLRVKPVTIRAWITQGRLMAVRLGLRVLLTEREIQRFIETGMRQNRKE